MFQGVETPLRSMISRITLRVSNNDLYAPGDSAIHTSKQLIVVTIRLPLFIFISSICLLDKSAQCVFTKIRIVNGKHIVCFPLKLMHREKKRGKKREEEKEKNNLKPESYILKIIYYVYRFYTFLIIILQIFTIVNCVKIILDEKYGVD